MVRKFITALALIAAVCGGAAIGAAASGNSHHAVQRATTSDGHIDQDHHDVCRTFKGTGDNVLPWQGGIAAYNVFHGGTRPVPGNEYDAGGDAIWPTLTDAQQTKWQLVAKAAILTECYPIVP